MVADLAISELGSATAETVPAEAVPVHWDVLDRLEKTSVGTRAANGTVRIRRGEPAGCFLYGPYRHLTRGQYRLTFRCRRGRPRLPAQPVLGIEIIVLARCQTLWRAF